MKDFSGTPGTFLGLILRMSQLIFAAASIASIATVTSPSFSNFTAFCFLCVSSVLIVWSFVLALLDAYALVRKKILLNPSSIGILTIGDWGKSTYSLAAASASAGIPIFYFNDTGHCHFGEECRKYHISVAFAFMS
ncbi:CASP-like protein 5B3 [Vicia villosa]|uniref:CASP-like protein 5B3 n=1 Tax=Vicia villosa TaxID=3911 RepID=UPI00273A88B8|nr:CASP-like protein 5B3 [Vicia villosa]